MNRNYFKNYFFNSCLFLMILVTKKQNIIYVIFCKVSNILTLFVQTIKVS